MTHYSTDANLLHPMASTNLESQWRDRIVHNFSHAKSQHQDDQQFAVHGTQSHPKVGANNSKVKIKKLHSRNSERKKHKQFTVTSFSSLEL
jgi:uncharacterized protein involved in outer membrane biogenesis